MRLTLAATLILLPSLAIAAGSDDSEPPVATETTTECEDGMIWDEEIKECVEAEDSRLDDDQRFGAVRELAYADRPKDALRVLASMTEGETSRVLTYRGFLLRETGRIDEGIIAYEGAIALDPGNILARSYYGQLLVKLRNRGAAWDQLVAIRAEGGRGTWAERTLAIAIATGTTNSY